MITFEECGQMLDKIADSLPCELYRDLNAGISLLPNIKIHPQALHGELFILGEYIRDLTGNSIVFYYGSINRIYGNLEYDEYYKKLEHIFHHEVRHHNEHLSGCDDLGICDDNEIVEYLKRNGVTGK